MRPRILSYDSTFGLEPTDPITLHINGLLVPSPPSLPCRSSTIRVVSDAKQGNQVNVLVAPK